MSSRNGYCGARLCKTDEIWMYRAIIKRRRIVLRCRVVLKSVLEELGSAYRTRFATLPHNWKGGGGTGGKDAESGRTRWTHATNCGEWTARHLVPSSKYGEDAELRRGVG